jgi:hypothetical protein
MRKLWIVLQVWWLMRKRHKISAIRLVRGTLIPHKGEYIGSVKRDYLLAKDFVEDVAAYVWPTHY